MHFVVVLAVAHTVLLRDQLLHTCVFYCIPNELPCSVGSQRLCAVVTRDMDLMKILSLRFAPPLQSDLLLSVALRVRASTELHIAHEFTLILMLTLRCLSSLVSQLFHRLPDELIYEIARHPFEHPDSASSLPLSAETIAIVMKQIRRQHEAQGNDDSSESLAAAVVAPAAAA